MIWAQQIIKKLFSCQVLQLQQRKPKNPIIDNSPINNVSVNIVTKYGFSFQNKHLEVKPNSVSF